MTSTTKKLWAGLALWGLFALGPLVPQCRAQEVEKYFDQLSSMPPLVGARAATQAFEVYGSRFQGPEFINPAYRASIQDLAARFSPIMKPNNGSVPQEVIPSLTRGGDASPLLHVDAWAFSGHDSELTRSWSLDLRKPATMDSVWALTTSERRRVRQRTHISPDTDTTLVMYLDFPGSNPDEWRRVHVGTEGIEAHAYVHFFLLDEQPLRRLSPVAADPPRGCRTDGGSGDARYVPVLQYWFFYPFNDGVNNHEGDWEHLNVVLTTEQAVRTSEGLLTAEAVCRMLTGQARSGADQARIRYVDYYFHHSVYTLDYSKALAPDDDAPRPPGPDLRPRWVGQDWVEDRLTARVERMAEHGLQKPIVYIGGNSVGLDVLISPPGARNRNPHGSYPFPGVWKHVGPLGSSERMYGDRRALNRLFDEMGGPETCPNKAPGHTFVCFDQSSLTLLPDWEVYDSPEAAWEHFWMVLPVRWGYPVTVSPGGGLVAGLNVGQEAPVGPSRSTGWNNTGPSRGFGTYEAHALPRTFQTGVQEGFGPTLGFLNWSDLALTLPPVNPLRLLGQYIWGALDDDWRHFNPRENLPARHQTPVFVARGTSSLDVRWVNALPIVPDGVADGDFTTPISAIESGAAWSAGVASHYGRLASETTFIQSESQLSAQAPSGGAEPVTLAGELRFRELHSDLRWSLYHGPFQPFISLGYGWTWTRLSQDGDVGPVSAGPGLWPNSGSVGVGAEVFLLQRRDAPVAWSNLDISLRIDAGRTWQELPILWGSTEQLKGRARDSRFDLGLTRDQIRLGIAVSF